MAALPTALNANIQASTETLWKRNVVPQVIFKRVLLRRLWENNPRRIVVNGKALTSPVQKDDLGSLFSTYTARQPLTAGSKTLLDNPVFYWKMCHASITYDADVEIQNAGGGPATVVDLPPFFVKQLVEGMRIGLNRQIYGVASDGSTTSMSSDTGADFNSIRQALTHDQTYGTLTRSASTTNKWWQGASISSIWSSLGTAYGDSGTARSASIDTVRKCFSSVQAHKDAPPSDWLAITGPVNYGTIKSQVDASRMDTSGSKMASYGFQGFMLDGIEIVCEPWLTNANATNSHLWFFLLHVPSWLFAILPSRNFRLMGWKHQAEYIDGYDEWLNRCFLVGNLKTEQPNASIFLSNMS